MWKNITTMLPILFSIFLGTSTTQSNCSCCKNGPYLVANYPRIVSGAHNPGFFNGISGGNVH